VSEPVNDHEPLDGDDVPPWLSGPPRVGRARPYQAVDPLAPGHASLVGAGLAVGLLLMAIQLWLLTVALDLYLAGHGRDVWSLALASGLIFAGGLGVLWLLGRQPRIARTGPRAEGER
jgi:hypothetical protein